jgi:hypothetical protein
MGLTEPQSLLVTLAIASGFAVVHLLGERIGGMLGLSARATDSLAGGLAAAYVFLNLLPRLADGDEVVARELGDVVDPTALLELAIFLIALAGFFGFYVLERLARGGGTAGVRDAVFWPYVAAFSLYSALIVYTLPLKLRTGVVVAALFSVVIALHLVMTDRVLRDHFGRHHERWGRRALAAGPLAGWLAVALVGPRSTVLITSISAFLAGAILLNVVNDELAVERHSSLGWFTTGLAVNATLLTLVTFLDKSQPA